MMILSILFGSIIGISLGLTGGGGAIFAVPLLTYGLGLPPRESVVISLVAVGSTSVIGFLQKWRRGEAELRTGLLFAFAGMVGAPFGTWLSQAVSDSLLMLLFSVLMLTIAVVMWKKGSKAGSGTPVCVPVDPPQTNDTFHRDGPSCQRDSAGNLILTSRCARLLLLAGIFSGILSGMFGVGGGFIIVPALVVFSSMSMARAVGTSLMVIALVSVSGIVSQLSSGRTLQWETTLLFVVGGIAGLWIGQAISHRLSSATLQKTFSVAILVVAIFIITRNLTGF